jgi:cell fate regulator YaaT (PSP1 superfamily)
MESEGTARLGNVVGVRFGGGGRLSLCDAGHLILHGGDHVIVDTPNGNLLGTVEILPGPTTTHAAGGGVRERIVKKADFKDIERDDQNRGRERDAARLCVQRVRERNLPMRVVKAEHAFDGGKIIFYFSADSRVDFRDLVRDLAHLLHTRVEMKQIGARDEAKIVGAVGPCGRELCCSTWLNDFAVVSVKMAKAQGLSLNPSKLAGMCGRLKCCLRYEYDTYLELGRQLPAVGKNVVSVKGDGVVTRQNILRQTVMIRKEDGVETEVTLEDLVEKKAQ